MKHIFIIAGLFVLSFTSKIAEAQEVKMPLIMKAFKVKVPEAAIYRFARQDAPVLGKRFEGTKILVVKEKSPEWLMVQIGGVNAYMLKAAVELHPEDALPEPFMISCGPYVDLNYRGGRRVPTGYRNQGLYIMSNWDIRRNSMR